MTAERILRLGRQTALISFLLGTTIFGIYFLTSSFEFIFIGYVFIVLIGLINIGVLISMLVEAIKNKDNRNKFLATSGLMLLNIPVMLVYCWFAIILLNTMRITIINSTQTTLSNINIFGCGLGHIDKLESGESETVWIEISGDCVINIDYLLNGQKKVEPVSSYVTNNMGQRMKHNIGRQNE